MKIMVLSIVFFTWDNQIGPIKEFTHPKTYVWTDEVITKIYMAHSFSEGHWDKPEFIEIKIDEMTYWSYCDRTRVVQYGYEILVLVFEDREKISVKKMKARFINFAHLIFKHTKKERLFYITSNFDLFFEEKNEKKVLLLGRAATGKSSIKKVIFEGKNPYKLLYSPLEPTLDLEPTTYSWLDLSMGIFDSSGQEIASVLQDEHTRDLAFENTAIVIYIIDIIEWVNNNNDVISDIDKILKIIEQKGSDTKLVLFLNKIDLINKEQRNEIIVPIKSQLEEKYHLPLFLTSICPELIYHTYEAFSELLGLFSPAVKDLKTFLDDNFKDFKKTAVFISNYNKMTIAQVISPDFNHSLINPVHEIVAQLIFSFENMQEEDMIDLVSISSRKGLRIYVKHLDFAEFDVSDLIVVTTALPGEILTNTLNGIKEQMYEHFYNKKNLDNS